MEKFDADMSILMFKAFDISLYSIIMSLLLFLSLIAFFQLTRSYSGASWFSRLNTLTHRSKLILSLYFILQFSVVYMVKYDIPFYDYLRENVFTGKNVSAGEKPKVSKNDLYKKYCR